MRVSRTRNLGGRRDVLGRVHDVDDPSIPFPVSEPLFMTLTVQSVTFHALDPKLYSESYHHVVGEHHFHSPMRPYVSLFRSSEASVSHESSSALEADTNLESSIALGHMENFSGSDDGVAEAQYTPRLKRLGGYPEVKSVLNGVINPPVIVKDLLPADLEYYFESEDDSVRGFRQVYIACIDDFAQH